MTQHKGMPADCRRNGIRTAARCVGAFASMLMAGWSPMHAQAPAEKNVVYGMYSGAALLLDVYRPQKSNGFGIIHIKGSGWQAGGPGYGAPQLKRGAGGSAEVSAIVEAGYTVF